MNNILFLLLLITSFYSNGQDPCYSNYRDTGNKGFLGKIDNQNLYYEIWENLGLANYNAILLRTDTTNIADSIDFCLDWEKFTDSIYVSIIHPDTTINFATTDANKVPTLFQVLSNEYGSVYNHTLKLKDKLLYVKYYIIPPYEEFYFISTIIFKLEDGSFRIVKSKNNKKKSKLKDIVKNYR